ncbi:MAG: hypothetical protein AAFP19_02185, partial [Bacteroidota bacterium]
FTNLQAQYFGRNKPRYQKFDFEVYESPHFEVYHYLENEDLRHQLTQYSEDWYLLHQAILQDTFRHKNPILFYNNHADFQQTNAISGSLSVGTGGVTEGFKNRVVMPITPSHQQTHHVLGHELVHAFQYHLLTTGDSTSLRSIQNLPLWLVEGLAEYLSIGRVDAHTAMWMRDAVLRDDVPTIKELANPRYFPYRYGQAFWAFLTGTYGDGIIRPFFIETAKVGLEAAIQLVLKTNIETLSGRWVSALETQYGSVASSGKERKVGKRILFADNAGRMNISPVISPNGKYVVFFSEQRLFSLDLYLAEAINGKIVRRLASTTREGHIDDFSSLESAGTWSPDSRRFALVAFKKGQQILLIKDIRTGKTLEEIEIEGVPAISNPAWSPDGKKILFTGLVDGQSDLYMVQLKNKKVTQLTNDEWSTVQANWSPNGEQIVFATDQISRQNGRTFGKWTFNLATLDLASRDINPISVFPGADNLNPLFDAEGNILFLSNRDGYRNIYRYKVAEEQVDQLTDLMTGVSGITPYSPALSVARKRDRLVFSHYSNNQYAIYQTAIKNLTQRPVSALDVDMTAATLPVANGDHKDVVSGNLAKLDLLQPLEDNLFKEKKYVPKFRLDHVGGGAGVGIAAGNAFGNPTALAGGVDMLFSDILGNNQLYTGLSLNGEIQDLGGQLVYINRKNKIAWGARLSHIPFRTGQSFLGGIDTLNLGDGLQVPAQLVVADLWRIFEDQAGVFAQWSLSKTQRFELGGAFTRYSYRIDRFNNYYDEFGRLLVQERERIDAPDGFNLLSVNAAFVGDNSYFGIASPLQGYRYRLAAEKFFGEWDFYRLTADFRKYQYLKPISLAFRALHFGNYGQTNGQLINSQFVGNPIFVRGYGINAFDRFQEWGLDIDQLTGSKLLVTNFEIRLPFTGPERLSAISSKFLFSELALFVDGGLTWDSFDEFRNDPEQINSVRPQPILSTGLSLRVNLFGALIVEPYYAFPIQQNTRGVFGLNIVPGW